MPPLRGVVLVTGTDTGVGKTVVTAAVATAATQAGLKVAVIKPAQTGDDSDETVIRRLAEPALVRTLVSYPDPLAPLAAARTSDRAPLELDDVVAALRAAERDHDLVLVEGAGGLLVPMGMDWTVADLATSLHLPAIVVTRPDLGTLNHTALTLEALRYREIESYLVFGTWPAVPELVHRANLADLSPRLHGMLPQGASSEAPQMFRHLAPQWLGPTLHGTFQRA